MWISLHVWLTELLLLACFSLKQVIYDFLAGKNYPDLPHSQVVWNLQHKFHLYLFIFNLWENCVQIFFWNEPVLVSILFQYPFSVPVTFSLWNLKFAVVPKPKLDIRVLLYLQLQSDSSQKLLSKSHCQSRSTKTKTFFVVLISFFEVFSSITISPLIIFRQK